MGALVIGMEPAKGAEGEEPAAPGAGPGPLAMEAVWKACRGGDFDAAYEAFKDLLLAADDEIGPEAGEPDADD